MPWRSAEMWVIVLDGAGSVPVWFILFFHTTIQSGFEQTQTGAVRKLQCANICTKQIVKAVGRHFV